MRNCGAGMRPMPLKRSWLNYHAVVTSAMEGGVGQGRWCDTIF